MMIVVLVEGAETWNILYAPQQFIGMWYVSGEPAFGRSDVLVRRCGMPSWRRGGLVFMIPQENVFFFFFLQFLSSKT